MTALLPKIDPDGLLEYSAVYTDRALNHMSASFQEVMKDISRMLKAVYQADAVAIVPGSGTFGMESVARQFATGQKCLVIRNGFFSYRWSQIFDAGDIPAETIVLKASPVDASSEAAFRPPDIDDVVAAILDERPGVVFAPHVETSSGIMLPHAYLQAVADAVHEVDGLFVLDCIASGAMWVDMRETGVDVLISAPQKGWSGSPCCALVMLSKAGIERLETTQSTSFACDLARWRSIMSAYETGGHAYHATMPTDSLRRLRNAMQETACCGFDKVRDRQRLLGEQVRASLATRGIKSVAARGFQAPGVVVSYTTDEDVQTGRKFADAGLQVAAGVPLMCDERADFRTFRIGLFGLDKLNEVERTVRSLEAALDRVQYPVQ